MLETLCVIAILVGVLTLICIFGISLACRIPVEETDKQVVKVENIDSSSIKLIGNSFRFFATTERGHQAYTIRASSTVVVSSTVADEVDKDTCKLYKVYPVEGNSYYLLVVPDEFDINELIM